MSVERTTVTMAKRESEEIYIIPKFSKRTGTEPEEKLWENIQFVLIINNLVIQRVTGYKTNMCLEISTNTARTEENSKACALTVEEVKKALSETNGYFFEILTEEEHHPHTSELTIFWSNRKEKIGAVPLKKISTSEALQVLAEETLTLSSYNSGAKVSFVESKLVEYEKKFESIEAILRNLIIEKNQMEDHMYRAFYKCLNSKKDKIQKLEEELNKKSDSNSLTHIIPEAKKKKSQKYNFVIDSSDSNTGSERDFAKVNHDQSSSEYNADTDVEMDVESNQSNSKRADSKAKVEPSSPNDSLNDSFPEFLFTRKLRSTTNQLKLNSKASEKRASCSADKCFDETSYHIGVSKSEPSHTLSKQPKIVEVGDEDLEVVYDCDKLMDEI